MSRPAPSPDHRALFAAGWPAVFCSSGALFAGTVGAKRGPFGTGLAVLVPHFDAGGDRLEDPRWIAACYCSAELLCKCIDIWPDNWAASPRTAGRTFQTLSKFDESGTSHETVRPIPRAHRQ